MGQVSDLYATLTPTPYVIPISDGSGTLNDWITALVNPMTTDQDIIVGGVGGTPQRLPVGAHGYVLTVGSGGLIDWEAATGGFTNPMTTSQDLIVGGISGAPGRLAVGSVGKVLTVGSGGIIDWETPAASGGTVTTVSVVSANGFAGTVATATTTPAITLTTTITGVLKGNGTAISAASAGTDYVAPGAITTSGLTMATATVLGRATAGTGAIEEIAVTGSGNVVLANTPTLITPVIGAATGTSLVLSGGLTSGAVAGTTGFVDLKGLTSGTVRLSVADAAGSWTLKLPTTGGTNLYVLQTDGSGNTTWVAQAGGGSGTVNSGTATQMAYYPASTAAVSSTPTVTVSSTGRLTFSPTAITTGATDALTIRVPNDTGITATSESVGVLFPSATRTWADGTTTTQREYLFGAPTYNKTTTSATFTNAATVVVGGPPVAGTGVTITNAYALWVVAGSLGFGTAGSVATITSSSGALTLTASGTNQNINLTPSGTAVVLVTQGGGAGGVTINVASTSIDANISFSLSGVTKCLVGNASTTNGISTGSIAGELVLRGVASGIAFSSDNGSTIAGRFVSSTGQLSLLKNITSTTTGTGTLIVAGGVGIAGAVFTGGAITTGTPSGGTAGAWKFGILVTAGVTPDTTRYIQLDVGGTLYKVIIST